MKRSLPFLLFGVCISLMLWSSQVIADINTIEIRILPESIVYDEYYNLGDIAELDGFDIETIQKIAKIQIGKSPLPGRSLLVSHGMVNQQIKRFDSKREFKIVLPSKPIVSRASVKIEKQQLEDLVFKEIKKQYENYDDVKIDLKSSLSDIYLPKGEVTYEISKIGKSYSIGGNGTWTLKLSVDGTEFKKLFVRAKVTVFDEVLVAKNRIPKGETIEKMDLKKITKNISKEHVNYQPTPSLVVGQQAKRDIYENESIRKKLVEKPVLIKKGSPVKLIYKTKNLLLTNIVKALKEGKRGEVIPVRPLEGERTIYAVVVDENSVEVAL